MTVFTWLAVAVAGGFGACARFLLDGWVSSLTGRSLPYGTFVVNISGAFLLGLLDGIALSGNAMVIAGTAAIGAYTTFSTWMLETHRLAEEGEFISGLLNVAAGVLVGFGAVALGHHVGTAL